MAGGDAVQRGFERGTVEFPGYLKAGGDDIVRNMPAAGQEAFFLSV
ncbi:hypothetical protein ACIBKY_52185 [Nonomuraea sp. NPDC050394]